MRLRLSRVATAVAAGLVAALIVGIPSAGAKDALPRGRTAAPIVDGKYPASYFPNTELLGAGEMRITALGTGMPNQTKRGSVYFLPTSSWVTGTSSCSISGMGSMANLFSLRPGFLQAGQGLRQPPAHRPRRRFHGASHRRLAVGALHTNPHLRSQRGYQTGAGDESLRRGHAEGLRLGPRHPHRRAAGQGWTNRGARIQLPCRRTRSSTRRTA